MSDIRVTYSGLINFIVGILIIFTGLIFILIVARTVTPQEFGTWSLINNLVFYVVIVEPFISFWATRETARDERTGKTAVLSSGMFSIVLIFAYIILANFLGFQTDANQQILLLGAVLVPLVFVNYTLTGINLGWKPQAIGYSTICFGITELVMALIFVYHLGLGVPGIIISAAVGYIPSIIILTIFGREQISNRFRKEFLKKWLKRFWLPLYPQMSFLVKDLDVIVFTLITGSVIGLAFWAAARAITTLVASSGTISKAMYAKLIQGYRTEILQENITLLFYFAFPLTAISIIFAKPTLFALNPIYEPAALIVVVLSLGVFFWVLSNTFQTFLRGIENVDVDKNVTFMDLIKSKLFSIPTIVLVQSIIHIVALTVGLILLSDSPQLDLVLYWACVELVVQIPFTGYFYISLKRSVSFKLEAKRLLKYLLSTVVIFSLIYILLEKYLIYKIELIEFIPSLILFVALGGVAYLIVTYFIDNKIRELFQAIIQEIRKKKDN